MKVADIDKTLKITEFDKVLEILGSFAQSALGRERCLAARPSDDRETVIKNLKITTQAQNAYRLSGNTLPISNIADIEQTEKKLKNRLTVSVEELKNLYDLLKTTRYMSGFLNKYAKDEHELYSYCETLFPSKETEEKVEKVFDENFNIKETATLELKSLFQSKRSLQDNLKDTVNSLLNNPSFSQYLQEQLYTSRDGRIVFQVRAEAKNKIAGIVHDVSQSGQTFYIEPKQIVDLNNRIREAESAIEAEIAKIIKQLSADFADICDNIYASFKTLIELDFVFARAKYSVSIDACEPEITEKRVVELKSVKNPVLLSVLDNVVENDFSIGTPYSTIIITGSNAGGKTVTLKTAALSVLMAKTGLHIPCFSAKIYPFKKIFAEIGDDQNIIQSLSTFSSHVKNLKTILDNADSDTFVVIDEIAAGTDPKEGACLARAVMEKLNELGAFSLVTTHFSELKSLPFNNKNFQNASVDFDVATLKPTYKLRIGVPGTSNAFAIAKNFGIPDEITKKADEYYQSEITDESKILASLQAKYSELGRLTEEARALKIQSEEKFTQYNKLLEELNAQKRKTIKDFKRRYEDNLQDAKSQIKKVLENLNHNKTKDNAIKSYKKLSEKGAKTAARVNKEFDEVNIKYEELKAEDIAIGKKAVIKDLDTDVTIASLPDKNGNLQVMVGQLKTNVNIKKLAKALKQKKDIIKRKIALSNSTKYIVERVTMSPKIDVRGCTVSDALQDLESFLDKASMINLSPIEIIHGHGTGQLRQAIRDYLDDSPYVAKYRPGEDTEGGNGVTIVDIN